MTDAQESQTIEQADVGDAATLLGDAVAVEHTTQPEVSTVNKNDVIILGFNASALDSLNLQQGFNPIPFETFQLAVQPHLVEMRRGDFENNPAFRHFISYMPLTCRTPDDTLIFAYQRGKGVGEQRLSGADSIGLGGHVDSDPDVVRDEHGAIDLRQTLFGAAERELIEEIKLLGAARVERLAELPISYPRFRGILLDDSDEVGRVHLGVIMDSHVAGSHVQVETVEEELITIGFETPGQLQERTTLESWSNLLINSAEFLAILSE